MGTAVSFDHRVSPDIYLPMRLYYFDMNRDLEKIDRLAAGSDLTSEDVDEVASVIDRQATARAMNDLEAGGE